MNKNIDGVCNKRAKFKILILTILFYYAVRGDSTQKINSRSVPDFTVTYVRRCWKSLFNWCGKLLYHTFFAIISFIFVMYLYHLPV